jgi:cytoskeleton protein RodZ
MPEIAEELCITQRYLRAIEEDDLKSLPGTFFYKSFVKQYAAILGIDEKKLQPGVDELTATVEPLPLPGADARYAANGQERRIDSGQFPVRQLDPIVQAANRRYFSDRRIGVSLVGLAAVLLACSGFYAWWNKAPQSPTPVRVTVQQPAAAGAVQVKAPDPASAPSAPTVDVTTTTDGLNHVVLNLSATEKTWLSITTTDGKRIFSGILEPSQTKTLTAPEEAKMKVGNAGGLEVLWNGKPIGPIGPRGQVRVVLFTQENFQILGPSETL